MGRTTAVWVVPILGSPLQSRLRRLYHHEARQGLRGISGQAEAIVVGAAVLVLGCILALSAS